MACSPKQKHVMKKAVRASKKDGKGGPMTDKVKAVVGAVSDKVKAAGDMKVKDAVSGIARAATLPQRVVGGAVAGGAAGAVSGAKRGIENALGRGQGKKKGLLKKQLKPMIKPMLPERRMAPAVMPKITPKPLPTGAQEPMKRPPVTSGSNVYKPVSPYRGKVTPVQKRPL